MNAADVMTANPVTVRPDTKLDDAVALFVEKRISGLPVLDAEGSLVGILTESDLLRRSETGTEREPGWLELVFSQPRLALEYVHTHGRTVAEVMTHDVVAVTVDTPLARVVSLMEQRHVRRLPVLDHPDGALVGIIARADLVRALGRILAERPAPLESDEAIRAKILAEVAAQPWAPSLRNLAITVTDGTVELTGVIVHDEQRKALNVLIAGVPGVKAVRDQLVWCDAVTGGLIPD
ncbi:MAG TPA: CBS domain-containing protein [Acetobacteraceae bacterium]|nr:CBS domain-containing protein [Acetobacteraceae bacterium]